METSPEEQSTPSDQPRVRRRLVQSTLFPVKPSLGGEREIEKQEECCGSLNKKRERKPRACANKLNLPREGGTEVEEGDECCGSQKKKRERKPRACSKKVAVKGQETLNGRIDDKDISAKPDLLADPSEGHCPQAEQQGIGSQEENNGACTPLESTPDMKSPWKTKRRASSTPKKKQLQTTPRKKNKNGNLKGAYLGQLLDCSPRSEIMIQVPDLRLEAKLKAEENARLFSGRKIHPFFSSCKMGKKIQETIDVDSWCPGEKKNSINLGPIHVFEKVQDDMEPMNWGNYSFSEKSFTGTDYDRQCESSPFSGKSVDSLLIDDFGSLSRSRVFLPQIGDHSDHVFLDQSAFEKEQRPTSLPILFADEPVVDCELIPDVAVNQEDHRMEETDFACGNPDSLRNTDAEWEDRFLHERMTTYYEGTDRHPENSLWTNKFLPEKAIEVCGNSESVNFLSEWLRNWYEKGFCSGKDITAGEKSPVQGDDYNCYGSDCDSENRDEANGLKNVLLVTGPVGRFKDRFFFFPIKVFFEQGEKYLFGVLSGKSAAIYACAKEQGFHVIEVNASDWRTRALVMQRFEGGMESYWVQRTVETPAGSESKSLSTSFAAMFSAKAVQGSDHEETEVIHLSDEEDFQRFTATSGKFVCESNKITSDRCENKPLILFEDVDAVLSEDHGLISTIQKLSETAKRPIILTSNSSNLVLPNNMDRHELCFKKPSVKELFSHAKKVCAAEKVDIQPPLVERFIGYCQGDIRKTIINLQFWCQGQKRREDRKGRRKYGPVFYDIDAWHQMLPKIIPWGYPSELSKVLEKEITQSLLAEETSKRLAAIEEEEQNQNEIHDPPSWRTPDNGSIKAKKEAIPRRHFPVQNGIVFSSPEISNSLESPVAFTRRNVRRKLDTVLSSDSEGEEGVNNSIPISRTNLFGINSDEDIIFQVDNASPAYNVATELCSVSVSEQLVTPKKEIIAEIVNPLSELLLNGTSNTVINNRVHLSGANVFENKNDNETLFEADSAVPFCYAETKFCSPAPSYCATSVMCSTPLSEQPVIPKENVCEKSFNPFSESPLKGTCEWGRNTEIRIFGENLLENKNNEIFFQVDSCAPSFCAATEMCSDLAPGQIVTSKEEMSKESFNPLPDPLLNGSSKSVDMSCAPELSFVPETQINGGLFSRDDELLQPVDSTYRSISKLERSPQIVKIFGVDIASSHLDEGDENNVQAEDGHSGYQVMDECSRMEFNGGANFKDKPRASVLPESVKEMWIRLRNCHSDLRQYFTPEERDASVVMRLAYEMSNLISEADILLGDCLPLIYDILEPSMIPCEKPHSFSWYDDHMSMASTIAQHGICLYTKEIAGVRPDNSSLNTMNLASEMLASSTSSMAIGSLVTQDRGIESSEISTPKSVSSLKSDSDPNLCSVIQSIVPARSYLATRGHSLYEYVSTLGHISRSETSRLSQSSDRTRLKRVRVARNYLSTGAMMFSPDDISLLGQYSSYKKDL